MRNLCLRATFLAYLIYASESAPRPTTSDRTNGPGSDTTTPRPSDMNMPMPSMRPMENMPNMGVPGMKTEMPNMGTNMPNMGMDMPNMGTNMPNMGMNMANMMQYMMNMQMQGMSMGTMQAICQALMVAVSELAASQKTVNTIKIEFEIGLKDAQPTTTPTGGSTTTPTDTTPTGGSTTTPTDTTPTEGTTTATWGWTSTTTGGSTTTTITGETVTTPSTSTPVSQPVTGSQPVTNIPSTNKLITTQLPSTQLPTIILTTVAPSQSTTAATPVLKIQGVEDQPADEEVAELFSRKDLIEAVEEALNAIINKQSA